VVVALRVQMARHSPLQELMRHLRGDVQQGVAHTQDQRRAGLALFDGGHGNATEAGRGGEVCGGRVVCGVVPLRLATEKVA